MRQPSTLKPVRIVDGEVVTAEGASSGHEQEQRHELKTANGQLESRASRDATGRELDALVAETMMGWRCVAMGRDSVLVGKTGQGAFGEYGALREVPRYSTDIAAALDALAQVGGIVTLRRIGPHEWHVVIDGHRGWWGETLPLAICRALLAAVRSTGETEP